MTEDHYRPAPKLWYKLKQQVRELRSEPPEAEQVLWNRLRNRQWMGFRFRRQHAIDRFVVDFFCKEAALVIEVDGPIHDQQKEEDADRDEILQHFGFTVIRYTNEQILCHLDNVLIEISKLLQKAP